MAALAVIVLVDSVGIICPLPDPLDPIGVAAGTGLTVTVVAARAGCSSCFRCIAGYFAVILEEPQYVEFCFNLAFFQTSRGGCGADSQPWR